MAVTETTWLRLCLRPILKSVYVYLTNATDTLSRWSRHGFWSGNFKDIKEKLVFQSSFSCFILRLLGPRSIFVC